MLRKYTLPITLVVMLILSATKIFGQQIHTVPDSLSASVGTGETTSQVLTIKNTGTDTLKWSIQVKTVVPAGQPARAFKNAIVETNSAQNKIVYSRPQSLLYDQARTSTNGNYADLSSLISSSNAMQRSFSALTPSPSVIVLSTTSTGGSIHRALNELGVPFDSVSTYTFSGVNLSPYETIIIGMDGGTPAEADVLALANAAASGKKLIMVGGTNSGPYYNGMSQYLLTHTGQQGWTTVSGTPHLSVTNPSHTLATNLPSTYNFLNSGASYYMLRISDPAATTVAVNGDGFPALVEKPIGSGTLVYFVNVAGQSYWSNQSDFDLLKTVIKNSLTSSWAQADLTQGNTLPGDSANVTITIDASNLVAGNYEVQIVITSNDTLDSVKTIPLHVSVLPSILGISADSLTLNIGAADSTVASLSISNLGDGFLKWNATVSGDQSSHVILSSTKGSVAAGTPQNVEIKILPIDVPGTYSFVINLTTNDTARPMVSVPVTVNVLAPIISLSTDSISINIAAADSHTTSLSIGNTGSGFLKWNASLFGPQGPAPTVHLVNSSGSVQSGTAQDLQLKISTENVSTGSYLFTITISSNDTANPAANVVLNIAVLPPIIASSPDSFNATIGTGDSVIQTLTIRNNGTGNLAWNIQVKSVAPVAPPALAFGNNFSSNRLIPSMMTNGSKASDGPTNFVASNAARNFSSQASAMPSGNGPKILLLAADATNDAQAALVATGMFTDANFTSISYPSTLSLSDLTPYDAVLVWTNSSFSNSQTVGDVLKQYVDGGGGVVMGTFAFSNSWAMTGGIFDPNYSPFLPSFQQSVSGTINMATVPNPSHPIFKNISADPVYWWNSNYSNPPLNTGGILLASDTYGNNVVAVNPSGKVIGMVIFPGYLSQGNASTYLLVANALNSVASPSWLTAVPHQGRLLPNDSVTVTIKMDASNLTAGEYFSNIELNSNDPQDTLKTMPVHLSVLAVTASLSTDSLSTALGALDSVMLPLTFTATGNGYLKWSGSVNGPTDPHVQLSIPSGTIPAGSSQDFQIKIKSVNGDSGTFQYTVHFTTNDTDNLSIDVPLTVTILPAQISASPDSFSSITVGAGDTINQTLKIKNIGAGYLGWSIDLRTLPPLVYYGEGDRVFKDDLTTRSAGTGKPASGTIQSSAMKGFTKSSAKSFTSPSGYRPKVLLMTDCDDPTPVADALVWTDLFDYNDIDLYSGYEAPSLYDLTPYDAIVMWTDCGFSYPDSVGNLLKQYVDNGGGLIIATFAFTNSTAIAGGILNPNYSPFLPDTAKLVDGSINMSTLPYPNHPIFKNISNAPYYWTNSSYSNPSLNTGGILLAQDNAGNNVVAVNPTGKIVGMVIWPYYLYSYGNSEASLLLANAVNFVASPPWLRFTPQHGLTASGDSTIITVTIDASNLTAGLHDNVFGIHSNDPLDSLHKVPVHINVLAAAASFSTSNINVSASASDSVSVITVSNTGAGVLRYHASMFNGSAMGVTASGAIRNGTPQSVYLKIFDMTLPGTYQDTILMSTNDLNNSIVKIPVSLTVLAPTIGNSPDSLVVKIELSDSTTRTLTINNTGAGKLVWNLNLTNLDNPSLSRAKKLGTEGEMSVNRTVASLRKGHNKKQAGNLMAARNSAASRQKIFTQTPSTGTELHNPGDFILKAESPVPVTCVAVDPTSNIIYAQENGGTTFYMYDPQADQWTQLSDCSQYSGNNGGAVYLNGKIYTTYTSGDSMGIYDIANDSWSAVYNQVPTGNIASVNGYIYLAGDYDFQRYNPNSMMWDTLTHPGVVSSNFEGEDTWGGLKYYGGYLYNFNGNGDTAFAKYNINSDQWALLPGLPGGAVLGSAIDPASSTLFAYGSYGDTNWYSFDLVNEQWSVKGMTLFGFGGGEMAFSTYAIGGYGIDDGGMAYVSSAPDLGVYFAEGEGGTGFAVFVTSSSPKWLSADPMSGITSSGGSQVVTLKFTADTLGIGDYHANITVVSNDTGNTTITIPVTLQIRNDAKPPHTGISFFQDKYVTQYVDVVVTANEPLGSAPVLQVTKPDNSKQNLPIDTVDIVNKVYYSHYKLDASGTFTFTTASTDTTGNSADTSRTLSVVLGKAKSLNRIASFDEIASLSTSENSLSQDVYLTVVHEALQRVVSETERSLSGLYTFGPQGIGLEAPITITFDYSKIKDIEESNLVIYRDTQDGYVALKSTVDRENKTVTASASQLGKYQLFYNASIKSDIANTIPTQFSLHQNYPNPFNPSTTIRFDLPAKSKISIAVYNILGQRVRTLTNREFNAGSYTVTWDGKNEYGRIAASGIYIYQITTDKFTQARKMLFLK